MILLLFKFQMCAYGFNINELHAPAHIEWHTFGDFLLSCSFVFNRPFLKYLKEAFFTLYSLFRDHLSKLIKASSH